MSHTPGPWEHDEKLPTSVWANGIWVASTNVETIRSLHERTANARLIAAAPELLDALVELRESLRNETGSNVCICNVSGTVNHTCPITKAEAAIKKARGEKP